MSAGIVVLAVIAWLACGIVGSGLEFAFAQDTWPSIAAKGFRSDMAHALVCALFGPANLIAALACTGFGEHGWRLWRKS